MGYMPEVVKSLLRKFDRRMTIRNKIMIGGAGIAIASMISFGLAGMLITGGTIRQMAENDLAHITDNLVSLCDTQYDINQNIVASNLNVADFFVKGRTSLKPDTPVRFTVENQMTKESQQTALPLMTVDNAGVSNDFRLVDRITGMIGGTVTIFQVMKNPDGLLRVSTSVKRADGTRAAGTYIPPSSPVYKAVMSGETYKGSAFVVNDWYITAYKPIYDGNAIIGAIYVGVRQSELEILRKSVLALKIGKRGYAYILDNHDGSRGNVIIHPTREGKNLLDAKDIAGNLYVKEMLEEKSGSKVYTLAEPGGGPASKRLVNFRSIDRLGWVAVAEADYDEVFAPLSMLRGTNILISILVLVIIVTASVAFSGSINRVMNSIKGLLTSLSSGDYSGNIPQRDIERTDEFGDMATLFNVLVRNTRDLLEKIMRTTSVLTASINDLTVSSREVSTTSNQQAAAVKEIVSTMEDSDALSRTVASRIDEVARIAGQTRTLVEKGFALIQDSLGKMEEIRHTNTETISGVKDLGAQIEGIWEVVNIINGIADQTKIIAFNAELEAASAGESGKNFRIVAAEVRRLADSTVSSTAQIKGRINEIQRASDSLILASEKGTERIQEGADLSSKLKDVFGDILSSAEISAGSSQQIVSSVNQQVSAFEQILITLKQISSGIDEFVATTRSTSGAAESLKDMGEELKTSLSRYKISE